MDGTTLSSQGLVEEIREGVVRLSRDSIARWSDLCQRFLELQRATMKEREFTSDDIKYHRLALGPLLKLGRIYQALMDPEDFDYSVKSEVRGRLAQLEESWRIVQEPRMSIAEADEIFKQCFPA